MCTMPQTVGLGTGKMYTAVLNGLYYEKVEPSIEPVFGANQAETSNELDDGLQQLAIAASIVDERRRSSETFVETPEHVQEEVVIESSTSEAEGGAEVDPEEKMEMENFVTDVLDWGTNRRRAYSASASSSSYASCLSRQDEEAAQALCCMANGTNSMPSVFCSSLTSPSNSRVEHHRGGEIRGSAGRRRHMSCPDKGKRPMNGFFLFAKSKRSELAQMYPNLDNRQISTMLGQVWKNMLTSEKHNFSSRAKEIADEMKRQNPHCWMRRRSASMSH